MSTIYTYELSTSFLIFDAMNGSFGQIETVGNAVEDTNRGVIRETKTEFSLYKSASKPISAIAKTIIDERTTIQNILRIES